jgi:hypothetical protein
MQQTAVAAAALYGRPFAAVGEASPDPAAIRTLASQVSGHVITTDASEYESARLVFNRAFDHRPALIVRCAGPSDVARALEFAQSRSLPLAVRGGGHSRAGFGVCEGGVVIDLSAMKRIDVDAGKHLARAEAGSLVRDLDQATQRFGLATTSGGCPNVGIAGFTLGGGEGKLMSKYGLACDNLIAAHVVTADGRQLEASQKSNADLFWAIRGGGGNFGVVTAFEYRLHPVGEVQSGSLTYPAGRISELLRAFAKFAAAVPDEVNIIAECLPSEEGPKFRVHPFYIGPASAANELFRPLRTPVKPQEDTIRSMSYLDQQMAGFAPAPFAHFQTNLFLPELGNKAVEAITTAIHDAPQQFRVLIVPLLGAVTRVAPAHTAFALRRPGYEVDMLGTWATPAERPAAVQWVKALRESLQPFAHGTYVNQLGETSDELVRAAYLTNYAHLAEIKKKYDPTNLLRINQNIKPA